MAQMHFQRAFVSVVLTMLALTTFSYGQNTKSAQTAQTPNVTAQPGGVEHADRYVFRGNAYEILVYPNGNGMINKYDGNSKTMVGVIMSGKVSPFANHPLGDAEYAFKAYKAGIPSEEGPNAETARVTQPQHVAVVGGTQQGNTTTGSGGDAPPSKVVWDAAAHTVTANGVQFSSDGKHLRMVNGPYANIGGEYETDAGHKTLGLLRSAVKGNVYAAGGDPSIKSFWEFYIGRDDQQAKQFFFSTNSMDVGGRSGTPTPFLQQIYDASQQILKVPAQDVPAWFHAPEGMERVKKFLPAAASSK